MTSTMTSPPSAAPSLAMADITLEMIDPALAERYLSRNVSNRHLRQGHVTALASDMSAGRWQESHMGLAFDTDGNLIDGQHRLNAIIKSGVPQQMVVVRNVPKTVQEVIDAGAARSAADALKLSNRVDSNHPAVAAAARNAILWGEGHHRLVRPSVNGARKVTNSEITAWVDDQLALPAGQPSILTAVAEASKWSQVSSLMSLSVSSFAFLLLNDIETTEPDGTITTSYDDALTFFTNLDDLNFPMGKSDPVQQLYLRLQEAKNKKESLRISQVLWFTITAWNAFRQNKALGVPFVKPTASGKYTVFHPKVTVKKGIKTYPLVPDPI